MDVGRTGVHDAAAALPHHEVGEVAEGVGDTVDVDAPLLQGLARVTAFEQPEFLAVADEETGHAAQQGGAFGDGVRGQGPSSKARRAAATARSASFSSPSAATANGSASAGSRISRVAPESAARHSPPTWMVCSACCPAMVGVAFRSCSIPLCHAGIAPVSCEHLPFGPGRMRDP